MMIAKHYLATLGAVAASLLTGPVFALDGAELYKERTCVACHGTEGRMPVMDGYPKIAGQSAQYLLAQMKDIQSGVRNNSHTVAMKNIMHMISDDEMTIVAEWLAGLPD